MDIAMTIGIAAAMAIIALLGAALALAAISGVWMTLVAAVGLQIWRPDTYETATLIGSGVLALAGEIIEIGASAAMTRRSGGSRAAAVWSVVGGLAGAILGTMLIPIPIVGTIVGAVAGAGIGATLAHRRAPDMAWSDAMRVGRAAASGRLAAIVVKSIIAAIVGAALVVGVVV